jgi:aminoglycoside phosphotransferase (APT) family kinase protein
VVAGIRVRPGRPGGGLRFGHHVEDFRPDERHVIHGDLVNRNVLGLNSKVTAVIDWGNALYGDWLYDAAWLICWWPWFPRWQDIDIAAELERHWEQCGGLPPGLHQRLRACLLHIGLDAMAYNAYRGPVRRDDLCPHRQPALRAALEPEPRVDWLWAKSSGVTRRNRWSRERAWQDSNPRPAA